MFAIIAAGGKQYKVAAGDVIEIEKIDGDVGAEVTLGPVLMAGSGADVQIGAPTLDGAKVTATIMAQDRGKKVIALKVRKRKDYRKKIGHRQYYTTVRIVSVQ
ncbi:MAG: 50S ribosomal protein L21 [Nitrospinota bacterium]|nr:50S ribosomal protein L21 [Nitrospinota bacterium]